MTATYPTNPIQLFFYQAVTNVRRNARKLITSMIAVVIFLAVWQLLCSGAKPPLPPPTKVLSDTWELIINPFFDNGGTDKGLFWHISASLGRVAVGFVIAGRNWFRNYHWQ